MNRGQRRRREAGVHVGASMKDRAPGASVYVHGVRDGHARLDRRRAERQWTEVRRRAGRLRDREIPIRRVSTGASGGGRRHTRGETRKDRHGRELVYKVATRWMSGSLSNDVYRRTISSTSNAVGAVNATRGQMHQRPGRVRCRNPADHKVCRQEARAAGVPTAGVVNSDCKRHRRLTYPIPGNDRDRRPMARYRERLKHRTQA